MRKGSHEADRARGKISDRAALQHQSSQNVVLSEQRHDQKRVESGRKRDIPERIIRRACKIRNADRLALLGSETQDAVVELDPDGADGILKRRVELVCLGKLEGIPRRVVAVDRAGIRPGELHRTRDDRGKDGLGIEGRGDGATDLLERLQFADRLREIAGTFRDLLLQPAVRVLAADRPFD